MADIIIFPSLEKKMENSLDSLAQFTAEITAFQMGKWPHACSKDQMRTRFLDYSETCECGATFEDPTPKGAA